MNLTKYLIIFSVLLFQACKNNITREKAKDMIIQKYNLPYDDIKEINLSYDKENNINVNDTQNIPTPLKDELLSKLEQAGIITYSVEVISSELVNETWWKDGLGYGIHDEAAKISSRQQGYIPVYTLRQFIHHNGVLTDKGKQYSKDGFQFKVGETNFGEITGMVENQAINMTEVKYSKVYNPNEIGNLIFNKQIDSSQNNAIFRKYDDGWRIE